MNHKYNKKGTSTEEQINILKNRGLYIENNSKTRNRIENIGYFKFKGYCFPYQYKNIKDTFMKTYNLPFTFDQVYNSYKFDQELHSYFLSLCNRIETQFKSRLGTYLSQKHDIFCYKNSYLFDTIYNFTKINERINEGIKRAESRKEKYIEHYKSEYDGEFPIWIVLEIISFGDMSKFFSDLKKEDIKEFSKKYYNINYKYITSWIHFIVIVRNYAAHNSRIFNKNYNSNLKISNKDKNKLNYDNRKTSANAFDALFAIKKMCKSDSFYKNAINKIEKSSVNLNVNLKSWGFPKNWKEILIS